MKKKAIESVQILLPNGNVSVFEIGRELMKGDEKTDISVSGIKVVDDSVNIDLSDGSRITYHKVPFSVFSR